MHDESMPIIWNTLHINLHYTSEKITHNKAKGLSQRCDSLFYLSGGRSPLLQAAGRLPAGMSCVRERNVAPQILHRKHALYYNG